MLVLGIASVIAGYFANPQWGGLLGIPKHWITEFLVPPLVDHVEMRDFNVMIALVSTGIALAGIALASALYLGRLAGQREPLEAAKPLHTLLTQKYYVDELYETIVVRQLFYRVFAGAMDWLDRTFVDGFVDFIGWVFRNIGRAIARLQTGQVQGYGVAIAFGSMLIIVGYLFFGSR
jgi:NADH-quinone oxidoreductase subunit L